VKNLRKPLCFLIANLFLTASFLPVSADEFSPDSITKIMRKVAQYRLSHGVKNLGDYFVAGTNWDAGSFMTGVCALYRHTKDQKYLDSIVKFGTYANWTPASSNPDEECCAQTFCESYMFAADTSKKYMYQPWLSRVTADYLNRAPSGRSNWFWCDALYMAPPGMAMLATLTGQTRILDSLYKCWWDDAGMLYSPDYHLYWRDAGYKPPKLAANGKPVFWAPGEAWVLGGQARVLKYTPANFHGRDSMITQFRNQLSAVIALQQGDGLWTTSLLDSVQWPKHETSSTAFFCFAMAWGINNRILDSATYTAPMRKAWSGLVRNVAADGKLMYCQVVGTEPSNAMFDYYSSSEGEGALLLAGEELYKRVTGTVEVRLDKASVKSASSSAGYRMVSSLSGKIALPAGSKGYEVYTMQGRKVCQSRLGVEKGAGAGRASNWRNGKSVYVVKSVR
jgi:unsaturated rhamnogalacturonyl hydrolase